MVDLGLIPGLGGSPGEGNGYPLHCSCLENSMDRGAWQATVHGVAKSQKQLSDFHTTKTSWRPSSMRLLHTFYSRNFKSSAYTFKSFNLFWVCVCVCVCTLCKLVVYFHSLYVSVQISQHYLLKGLPFILWSFVLDWVSEWSHSVVFDSVTPWTVATRLLHPWNFPGKNTEVGCYFLLPCPRLASV